MPAEEVRPVDKAGPGDGETEPRRRSGGSQFVPAVSFGLGVAALAGIVVTTGAVTPSASSVSVSPVSGSVVVQEPAIHQLSGCAIITCTHPNS